MRRRIRPASDAIGPGSGPPLFLAEPNHYSSYVLSPRSTLEGKGNFGRNIFVERDGSTKEVIRLNVLNDRHREDIIAFHFCMQYAKVFYGDSEDRPEFYVVGRDDPWDFRYVMHDASRFNIEICRVASEKFLKVLKAENDCSMLLQRPFLRGFEIQKIERCFPGLFSSDLIRMSRGNSGKKTLFENTHLDSFRQVFLRPSFDPRVDVSAILKEAITKKLLKSNNEKDETHLILDNLTTHATAEEFFEAFHANASLIDSAPFMCIWLYTGYYSDDDGNNCEFALMPIKLSDVMERRFSLFIER